MKSVWNKIKGRNNIVWNAANCIAESNRAVIETKCANFEAYIRSDVFL